MRVWRKAIKSSCITPTLIMMSCRNRLKLSYTVCNLKRYSTLTKAILETITTGEETKRMNKTYLTSWTYL